MTSAFDPGEPIGYAEGGEWLDAYVVARTTFSGDAFVDLFSPDAVLMPDPFMSPLTGSNAIRAYLGSVADSVTGCELEFERHWVSGATLLAAWHGSFVRRVDGRLVREAGFMTAEFRSGRCERARIWTVTGDDRTPGVDPTRRYEGEYGARLTRSDGRLDGR
jgi:hypothetical protein